jgi:hypothetical protein
LRKHAHIDDGHCVLFLQATVPSGKLSHSNGKSPFLMGKLTINGHFQ